MNTKRIAIAAVFGLVCGCICLALGHFLGKAEVTLLWVLSGLVNRTAMGFAIGTSGVKGNVFVRGAIYGLVLSVGPALASGFGADKFIPYCVAGTIYGVLIDALTSKVFKADVA
jgi:hypothetical protein